ncbi:hypothetical protein HG530_001468 [Fusarium avenaceum]|nr:hypothetical protein HG530_001468 [Fusarium avenaceum]
MARLKKTSASSDKAVKPRRAHRKSRNGCGACKKKHMKCDESQPICQNCNITDRECLYINIGPRSPPQAASSSGTPLPLDASSSLPLSPLISTAPDASIAPGASIDLPLSPPSETLDRCDLFDLNHFTLYHYLLTNFAIISDDPDGEKVLSLTLDYALKAPYLMNQLLAIAALHLSKPPAMRQPYHQLAVSLQTRALTSFNDIRQEISEETCIPLFLFSSLLGIHILCDTLQGPRENFSVFLDRFVNYLSIHRGVRPVTKQSWSTIRKSGLGPLFQRIEDVSPAIEGDMESIEILNKMIESNACPPNASEYHNAVLKLQESLSLHATMRKFAEKETARSAGNIRTFCSLVALESGFMDYW